MGYGRKIYDEACAQLAQRRQRAEGEAARKREELYTRCPRARELKEQMGQNAARAAKAVLRGGDVRGEMEKLRDKGLALMGEYDRLLQSQGLSREALEPAYACQKCKDTGFVDGLMCDCLKQLQRSLAYAGLSMSVPLERCTFQAFSLDYYKDDPQVYAHMKNVLQACQDYAARLRPHSSSLLFWGGTGLGKTHLSLAIAGEAIAKGFGVIYGSAHTFANAMERERFDSLDPDAPGDSATQLLSCDLLILDDLGTEAPTAYINAALYNIVNTRMQAEKPTIISTNLSISELESRYTQRFASRIAGYYGKIEFKGSDIRIQSRLRR